MMHISIHKTITMCSLLTFILLAKLFFGILQMCRHTYLPSHRLSPLKQHQYTRKGKIIMLLHSSARPSSSRLNYRPSKFSLYCSCWFELFCKDKYTLFRNWRSGFESTVTKSWHKWKQKETEQSCCQIQIPSFLIIIKERTPWNYWKGEFTSPCSLRSLMYWICGERNWGCNKLDVCGFKRKRFLVLLFAISSFAEQLHWMQNESVICPTKAYLQGELHPTVHCK